MQDHTEELQTPIKGSADPSLDSLSRHASSTPTPLPRTPEPQQAAEVPILEPPHPPRFRVKRRRPGVSRLYEPTQHGNEPSRLPSIELSEPTQEQEQPPSDSSQAYHPLSGSLPSSSLLEQFARPPRTPLGQITADVPDITTPMYSWASMRLKDGHSIQRPSSTLSDHSLTSTSSGSSLDTFPSYGDSCTSPDSDMNDPFVFPEPQKSLLPSAMEMTHQPSRRKDESSQSRLNWTSEMDEHLWLTYLGYLSDPTVTPFKTLPGTAPPLGVCCRVARQAKKSWKGPRSGLTVSKGTDPTGFVSLNAAVHEDSNAKSSDGGVVTTSETWGRSPNTQRVAYPAWPRKESSTRKRLRFLCKRKPTLAPHYQRLMQSRSPSPVESITSSRTRLSSPPTSQRRSSSFSTRDMNLNLVASTAESMQPDAPIAQLSHLEPEDQPTPRNRVSTHQKSRSLQDSLGLRAGNLQQTSDDLMRLASPFQGTAAAPHQHQESNHHATTASLGSPLELHHPRPLSGSMKRRAQYPLGEEMLSDDPDLRRNYLEDMFNDPGIAIGKRRVRSRGFSLGAMRSNQSRSTSLAEMFSPPISDSSAHSSSFGMDSNDPIQSNAMTGVENTVPATLAATAFEGRRLGSPFAPFSGHRNFSNTFPRNRLPSGLSTMSEVADTPSGNQDDAFNSVESPQDQTMKQQV